MYEMYKNVVSKQSLLLHLLLKKNQNQEFLNNFIAASIQQTGV